MVRVSGAQWGETVQELPWVSTEPRPQEQGPAPFPALTAFFTCCCVGKTFFRSASIFLHDSGPTVMYLKGLKYRGHCEGHSTLSLGSSLLKGAQGLRGAQALRGLRD